MLIAEIYTYLIPKMKIKLISNITFVIPVKIKVLGKQEVEMINWNVIRIPGSALEYVTLQLIYW